MAIKLFSPAVVVVRRWLDEPDDKVEGLTPEYFALLKNEMDAMRTRDPQGRKRSNAGSGWQSNDGIDNNPIFNKLMRNIKKMAQNELLGFCGFKPGQGQIDQHNAWGNINYKNGSNQPHLHNGCSYSGACYIHADGDEGDIRFIETSKHFVGMPVNTPRMEESWAVAPRTGDILLFPSGLMHMVSTNTTDKDRYSISFNMDIRGGDNEDIFINEDEARHEKMDNIFKTDHFGKLIQ